MEVIIAFLLRVEVLRSCSSIRGECVCVSPERYSTIRVVQRKKRASDSQGNT
jgi:hypothetical protein